MKKVALYLGLAPDADFEDYDDELDRNSGAPRPQETVQPRAAKPSAPAARPARVGDGTVRAIPIGGRVERDSFEEDPMERHIVPEPIRERDMVIARPVNTGSPSVRAVPQTPRMAAVDAVEIEPGSYADVQAIADRFKDDVPVIMLLDGADRELRKRLVDFSAGLCYGLSGKLERINKYVYLLRPDGIDISPEDKRKLKDWSD